MCLFEGTLFVVGFKAGRQPNGQACPSGGLANAADGLSALGRAVGVV